MQIPLNSFCALELADMPILPFFLDMDRPWRFLDRHFCPPLVPEDMLNMMGSRMSRDHFRTWKHMPSILRDFTSTIKTEKTKYQINLDVQHFSPEEIFVKTSDGYLVIEGRHKARQDDHGYVTREFMRRYALPENCKIDAVESRLSSDGILTVTAPLSNCAPNERVVPIMQTGPVRKQAKSEGPAEPAEGATAENGQ